MCPLGFPCLLTSQSMFSPSQPSAPNFPPLLPPSLILLQFKQPLLGSIRSLALSAAPELRPLSQAVAHAVLCPCHAAPTNWARGGAALPVCCVSGAPLDGRQCGRDERIVQVGAGAAGALHLLAPFNIAAVAGAAGGGPATLSVLARIKASVMEGRACIVTTTHFDAVFRQRTAGGKGHAFVL